ncbi:MAG: hypothetical protein KC478_09295, partial [Bacteriovoracaceae bacterium]|nr:hypothetical protein [Bacteriovoracaceae bacterium]
MEFFNSHGKELMAVQVSFLDFLEQFKLKEYFVAERGMERIVSMLQYFSFSLVNYLSLFVLSFVYYVFIFIAPEGYLERYLDYGKVGVLLRTYIKYKFFFSLITALSVSL